MTKRELMEKKSQLANLLRVAKALPDGDSTKAAYIVVADRMNREIVKAEKEQANGTNQVGQEEIPR